MQEVIFVEMIIMIGFILGVFGIIFGFYLFLKYNSKKEIKKLEEELELEKSKHIPIPPPSIRLTFDECNIIIDNIIDDIWNTKYYLNYRLRDLTMIPSMDTEISKFVEEVYKGIGDPVKLELLKYYSYEYLIQRITRKSQMLFVEYIDKFKPNSK